MPYLHHHQRQGSVSALFTSTSKTHGSVSALFTSKVQDFVLLIKTYLQYIKDTGSCICLIYTKDTGFWATLLVIDIKGTKFWQATLDIG